MTYSRRDILKTLAGMAAIGMLPACHAAPAETQAAERNHAASAGNADALGPLKIGVIGAGWLGGTVGRLWVRSGHEVMFSARNLDKVRSDVAGLGERAKVGTPKEAAAFGDILLFAVPYEAMPQLGRDLAAEIRGKIVLDATNTWGDDERVQREAGGNVGVMSSILLADTRLVRAFSAVDATAIEASYGRSSNKLGVPLAGNDNQAVQVAARLVRDAGCEPVIVGNLAASERFQRGGPGFRANTNAEALRQRLGM